MIVFILFYTIVSLIYRFAFEGSSIVKENFEKLAIYAYDYTKVFPISFVLGFYVTVVFDRWWMQFKSIPWPDRVVYNVSAHVLGNDEEGRIIRRTLARYVNLAAILVYRSGSKRVKKRFPTLAHLVEAGLMTDDEKDIFKNLGTENPKYWVPCAWFVNLCRMCRKQARIISDPAMKTVIDELNNFQNKCFELYGYDWIVVPLVYTQVVTIATYSYFLACLFGRQYLDPKMGYDGHTIDVYVPGFTVLEFVFYVGWLKVAENLMNPFGEDDDDFDMNWIVDRNIETSFMVVDELYEVSLPIVRDRHFSTRHPDIPYTNAAVKKKGKPWLGSASKVKLSRQEMAFTNMPNKVFTEDDECITSRLSSKKRGETTGKGGGTNNGSLSKVSKSGGGNNHASSSNSHGLEEKRSRSSSRNEGSTPRVVHRTMSQEDSQYDHYASIPNTPQIPQADYESVTRRGQSSATRGSNHGNKYTSEPEVHRRLSKSTEERKRLASDRQHPSRHHRNTQSLEREGNYSSGHERAGSSAGSGSGGGGGKNSGGDRGKGSGTGNGGSGGNYHRSSSQDRGGNYHATHERNSNYHNGYHYDDYQGNGSNEGRQVPDDVKECRDRDADGVIDARDVDINALNESII
ncbi:bestrophin-2-like [Lytechinus variegatus]|uniref:bestrophin-2-like n=1 Tax=Lytechinus variegatus TaxID=7654 RepID=UPI001BB19669|nr:bestrophin-2-like [Lytechinus variegatus]